MEGAATVPEIIEGEELAPTEKPLTRVPLVLNRRSYGWVTERIAGAVENRAPRWWWVAFAVTSAIAAFGLFCLGYQISTGVGTWGLNHPVGWAWDITNFVFWIGIGHAGTLDLSHPLSAAPEMAHLDQSFGGSNDPVRGHLRCHFPRHPRRTRMDGMVSGALAK